MQKKDYECNICKKAFSSICSLQRHLKTINHNTQPKTKSNGPHTCNICQNKYTQPHSLKRHIKIDHNGHPTEVPTTAEERSKHPSNGTECYTCQRILPTIHQFLRHNQNHHKNQLSNASYVAKHIKAMHALLHTPIQSTGDTQIKEQHYTSATASCVVSRSKTTKPTEHI